MKDKINTGEAMIKETIKENETVKPNSREMAVRKELVASGFGNDGRMRGRL